MSTQLGALVGFARAIPDVATFVTPVFSDEKGRFLAQHVVNGRVVGFTQIACDEDIQSVDCKPAIRVGESALYGFETARGDLLVGHAHGLAKLLANDVAQAAMRETTSPHTRAAIERFIQSSSRLPNDGTQFSSVIKFCRSEDGGTFVPRAIIDGDAFGDVPIDMPELSIAQTIASRRNAPTDFAELMTLNKNYLPGDQYNALVQSVVTELCNRHKAQEFKLRNSEDTRWDSIAAYVLNGYFEFCYDPYFLTDARRHSVGVVQFGTIGELSIYVAKLTPLHREISRYRKEKSDLPGMIRELRDRCGLDAIGVLGECVSTSEVQWQIKEVPGVRTLLKPMRDEFDMRAWIGENPAERIIVGDIGFMNMLNAVSADDLLRRNCDVPEKFSSMQYVFNDSITRFKMRKDYPVGFVYPRYDADWKKSIQDALVSALRKTTASTYEQVAMELETIGVKALPLADLCRMLDPMLHDQILAAAKFIEHVAATTGQGSD